ncbi:phage protein Gp27 family protein [Azorhizobium caulinodans]|uniref:phage protein Gp27 family protein n=1 Tax=Azorhizobium caulinodans TaxID=7 RepID=UPI002FBF1B42
MSGRGRLTFWDTLPDWADEARLWAMEQLAERKLTQLEITDGVNERIRAAAWAEGITSDIPVASKSSLNRLAMRRAAAVKKMAEAKALYEGLASQFNHENTDESAIVLGEFLKTLVLELTENGTADTPKGAMELARAYQSIVQGMKVSADRRQKLEAEIQARAEAAVEKVAKQQGGTPESIAALKAAIGVQIRERG